MEGNTCTGKISYLCANLFKFCVQSELHGLALAPGSVGRNYDQDWRYPRPIYWRSKLWGLFPRFFLAQSILVRTRWRPAYRRRRWCSRWRNCFHHQGKFLVRKQKFYTQLKEEDRLSAIVQRITGEFVVPRGAFLQAPNGLVYQNKVYSRNSCSIHKCIQGYFGHNESDSAHLSTWFHFRKDAKHQIPKVTEFADADPAVGKLTFALNV